MGRSFAGWAFFIALLSACGGKEPLTPPTLIAKGSLPGSVTLDATGIYWTDRFGLHKTDRNGAELYHLDLGAEQLAVDGEHLYWTGSRAGPKWTVTKVPRGGGDPVELTSSSSTFFAIAVDATQVYWSANQDVEGHNRLLMMPKDGGTPVELAADQDSISDIVADGGEVFWVMSTPNKGTVMKAEARQGATPVVLATLDATPWALVVDGPTLYLTNNNVYHETPTSIMSLSRDGGSLTILIADEPNPFGLAIDATHIYWSDASKGHTGRIRAMPRAGGAASTLAEGQGAPNSLAADESHLYWTNVEDGKVMMLPKR